MSARSMVTDVGHGAPPARWTVCSHSLRRRPRRVHRPERPHNLSPDLPRLPQTLLSLVSPPISSSAIQPPHSYVAHSSFALVFPLHLLYLVASSDKSAHFYLSQLSHTLASHFSQRREEQPSFPYTRLLYVVLLMLLGLTGPGLLWYCSVSMSSYAAPSDSSPHVIGSVQN